MFKGKAQYFSYPKLTIDHLQLPIFIICTVKAGSPIQGTNL